MTEDYNKMIGTRVKMLRITKGISQTELAKQIGVTQTHLSNIENGRCSANIDVILHLHDCLKVPIAAFFEEIDEQDGAVQQKQNSSIDVDALLAMLQLLKKAQ